MASTYLKFLMLVTLLALFNACEDDKIESSCDALVVISSDKYQNGTTEFYSIISAKIIDDCLEIEYSSSGCDGKSWSEEMVDAAEILESFPIQRKLKMLLDNQEACAAVFTKTVSFDLTPIRTEDYSKIILNIDGLKEPLLYRYGSDSSLEQQIQKKWNLVNINGGLAGVNTDFPVGSIIWEFDAAKVNVTNNNPLMGSMYDGLGTGTYDYSIQDLNGFKTLKVDKQELGTVYIQGNKLVTDQRAAGSFRQELVFAIGIGLAYI